MYYWRLRLKRTNCFPDPNLNLARLTDCFASLPPLSADKRKDAGEQRQKTGKIPYPEGGLFIFFGASREL